MANPKLSWLAGSLESTALAALWRIQDPLAALMAFVIPHAGASAVVALIAYPLMPARYRQPRRWVLAFLFLFGLLVPVLGGVGLLAALFIAQRLPKPARSKPYKLLNASDFNVKPGSKPVRYGVGGLRARLLDRTAAANGRLQALLAVQAMPARLSSPLLRQMLDDPVDDIRLLAYGMLDGREKKINGDIHLAQQALALVDASGEGSRRAELLQRLAGLYWELIYQSLVQGDVRSHARSQALEYVSAALTLRPEDPALWVLLGKIVSDTGQVEASAQAYERAITLGYPRSRLIPYLAEIAFRLRNFTAVKALLAEQSTLERNDKTKPLADYWLRQER